MKIIAGTISTMIFTISSLPMLIKARTTKNLRSYSLCNLVLSNLGNIIHWLYVISLPLGPIWFLHGFATLSTILMLVWFLKFRRSTYA